MTRLVVAAAAVLIAAAAITAQTLPPARQAVAPDGWRSFEATFSATGERQTIPTEHGKPAVTVQLSGPLAITTGEGLSRGFRFEVIGFDDGAGLAVLRGVWTDQRGDRIFSQLKGETVASGRRFTGTITGGTGRYAGISGEYAFDWQYMIEGEVGTINGRAVDLRGRYRAGGAGR